MANENAAKLMEMLHGSWKAQAIHAAAELGIADILSKGPMTAAAVAAACGGHEASVTRLLRALGAIDICKEHGGLFEMTATGVLLGTEAAGSLRSWAIWWGAKLWPVWGQLTYSVKTGESARKLLAGTKGYEHLQKDEASAALFNRALAELTWLSAQNVVAAYDFSGFGKIADIGGGYGELLAAILRKNPAATGILFDLSHAIEGGKKHLEESGLAGRCAFVAGDFFESVPAGADAYVLKAVMHNWRDEDNKKILETCRRAMGKDARLLLVEHVVPDKVQPLPAHQALMENDLTMLVAHGAKERTEAEFRALLDSAGFRVQRIVPAGVSHSVIEATP